jgi:S1-C subfamily serine protease
MKKAFLLLVVLLLSAQMTCAPVGGVVDSSRVVLDSQKNNVVHPDVIRDMRYSAFYVSVYRDDEDVQDTLDIMHNHFRSSGIAVAGTNGKIYLWTAHHAIDKTTNPVEGKNYKVLFFREPVYDGGDTKRLVVATGKLIGYDEKLDIALYEFNGEPKGLEYSVKFAIGDLPKVGSRSFHAGYPQPGPSTTNQGMVARYAVMEDKKTLRMHITNMIRPGSSGGGVYNYMGLCIGMAIAYGTGSNIGIATTSNSMYEWANSKKLLHAFPHVVVE